MAELGKLPVPNFAAGGVATPADAALMRQLGAEAVFVGSGIFKSEHPEKVAQAVGQGHHPLRQPRDPGRGQCRPGEPMRGLELAEIPDQERLASRRWRPVIAGLGSASSRCRETWPSTPPPSARSAPSRSRSASRATWPSRGPDPARRRVEHHACAG